MIENFLTWIPEIRYILSGILVNIEYTLISVTIGLFIGAILAISKVSRFFILRACANAYTSVFRGTPLIIQISIIYYVLPGLIGVKIAVFTAAILAFSLNSGAYVSEVLRSGINSVDKGQIEAAKALGVSDFRCTKDIILPQAVRKILPALVNECINMLKETSLISIIGESEILLRAQAVASQKFNYIVPMLTAAAGYYVVVLILVYCAGKLEQHLEIK
jgi:polar amino acid transport system permease protein